MAGPKPQQGTIWATCRSVRAFSVAVQGPQRYTHGRLGVFRKLRRSIVRNLVILVIVVGWFLLSPTRPARPQLPRPRGMGGMTPEAAAKSALPGGFPDARLPEGIVRVPLRRYKTHAIAAQAEAVEKATKNLHTQQLARTIVALCRELEELQRVHGYGREGEPRRVTAPIINRPDMAHVYPVWP